jgi:hypothetical protein
MLVINKVAITAIPAPGFILVLQASVRKRARTRARALARRAWRPCVRASARAAMVRGRQLRLGDFDRRRSRAHAAAANDAPHTPPRRSAA